MGKSAPSCFKIIACGGSDSVDHDDLQTPESKVSSSRSGWSFRKKSPKHRVLSNTVTVISEAPAVVKERQESSAANFDEQPNLTVPEKTPVIQCEEQKDTISSKEDVTNENSADVTNDNSVVVTIDESSIILIQAAIRGYLARRVLLKEKNAIKLQAVVRGHLVRCHAVGTLRCVQAIVKMQALVRARHANRLVRSKREAKPNVTYISIEKLLSNRFARQLMESTPRTKAINIKCDPSKDDSAWQWLERWMASSPSNESPLESKDLKSPETSQNVENSLTYDADNLEIHSCSSISPSTSHPNLQDIEESDSRYDVTVSDAVQMNETHLISEVDTKSLTSEDEQEVPDVFIAAVSKQSPTEILSGHYPEAESSSDNTSKEIDNSISNASAVQIAISECGTELSISSTLDSPDISEGVNDLPKVLDHPKSIDLEHEANPDSNVNQLETPSPLEKQKLEADEISDLQASPRSHIPIPESQVTPSSQVSLNSEKSRGRKKRPLPDKKIIQDSATESTPKEFKIGKRRDSFGSAKLDQEPRDSSSGSGSNSVPSYMQATESARAKAIANGSPKSSPDVQEKDIVLKNRLSLPGNNGRQGSPRINRSPSQPQTAKGNNGLHSPQDRKWKR